MEQLQQHRIALLEEFAQMHVNMDELVMDETRLKRCQDRAWNILQDIKKVSQQLSLLAQQAQARTEAQHDSEKDQTPGGGK